MDDIEKLKFALEKIPCESLSSKIRKLMPTIVKRLQEGVSQEVIVKTLADNGLQININTFRTHLYRYRQKSKQPSVENSNFQLKNDIEQKSNAQPSLEELLDPRKREEFGEKYLQRKSPIFKNPRSKDENSNN